MRAQAEQADGRDGRQRDRIGFGGTAKHTRLEPDPRVGFVEHPIVVQRHLPCGCLHHRLRLRLPRQQLVQRKQAVPNPCGPATALRGVGASGYWSTRPAVPVAVLPERDARGQVPTDRWVCHLGVAARNGGKPGPGADVAGGEPSPGADMAGGEPSPGADVAGGEPGPGADMAGGEPSPGAAAQNKAFHGAL
jgi:hypothetical protein